MKNQTLTIVINFKDGAEMGDALARAVDDLSNGCKERKGHSLSYWIRDDVALLREAEGYAMGEVLSDWDDSYTFEQVCAYLSDEYDGGGHPRMRTTITSPLSRFGRLTSATRGSGLRNCSRTSATSTYV